MNKIFLLYVQAGAIQIGDKLLSTQRWLSEVGGEESACVPKGRENPGRN